MKKIREEGVDMILAGFPCNDLSSYGLSKGFEGAQSSLFFTLVEILNFFKEANPHIKFIVENVVTMSHKNRDIISSLLGVAPIKCCLADISAQRRNRYIWTNIKGFDHWPPPNHHTSTLLTRDIAEPLREPLFATDYELRLLAAKNYKGNGFLQLSDWNGKTSTLTQNNHHLLLDPRVGKYRHFTVTEMERLQGFPDGYVSETSTAYSKARKLLAKAVSPDLVALIVRHAQPAQEDFSCAATTKPAEIRFCDSFDKSPRHMSTARRATRS
jgi:site-specific DNA-cytosine methylase